MGEEEALFASATQDVAQMELLLAKNSTSPTVGERTLRLALEADDAEVLPAVKTILRREVAARFPAPSRYVDTQSPMFPVGKLPSRHWAYAGCFHVHGRPGVDYDTLAVRNHSSLPTVLNDTISRNRKDLGVVRWSTQESILVVPRSSVDKLNTLGLARIPDAECDISAYTAREDNSAPPVELYTRVSEPDLAPSAMDIRDNHAPPPPAPAARGSTPGVTRTTLRSRWVKVALWVLGLLATAIIVGVLVKRSSWRPKQER